MLEKSNALENKFQQLDLRKLSISALQKEFSSCLRAITDFADVYTRTEPACLKTLDAKSGKRNQELLTDLGKMRLELRHLADKLFFSLIGKIIKEVAGRTKIKASDLVFYTHIELRKLFQGEKVAVSIISARQKGYALIALSLRRKRIISGRDYRGFADHIDSLQMTDKDCLKGKTTQPGVVQSIARVVQHNKRSLAREIARFRKGRYW